MKAYKTALLAAFAALIAVSCGKTSKPNPDPDPDPDPVIDARDLSSSGTANCYIVSEAGAYSIKLVKGNTTSALDGTAATAEVLWESYGNNDDPSKGDIIDPAVKVSGDRLTFSTGKNFHEGNAVIAVKDSKGKILWSWHIWVCKGYNAKSNAQKYNGLGKAFMDRNIGATSAEPGKTESFGLIYQWGRKDPFLAGCKPGYVAARSTASWPSVAASDGTKGSIDFAVANPMSFITSNWLNLDWLYTGTCTAEAERWTPSTKGKSMYDPCPAGWRVPDGGDMASWAVALGDVFSYSEAALTVKAAGKDFGSTGGGKSMGNGSIWYPSAGVKNHKTGALGGCFYCGSCWSATSYGFYAYNLAFNKEGSVAPAFASPKSSGFSVRCIEE